MKKMKIWKRTSIKIVLDKCVKFISDKDERIYSIFFLSSIKNKQNKKKTESAANEKDTFASSSFKMKNFDNFSCKNGFSNEQN